LPSGRRERMSDLGIPPAVARRRARIAMTDLVTISCAMTIGVIPLTWIDGGPVRTGPVFFAVFMGAFIPILAPMLCQERGKLRTEHGHDGCLLTAATLSGMRTVDLSKLVRVRRVVLLGKFGRSIDLLVVTDSNGVRIGLASWQARAALRRALHPPAGRPPLSPPKVTRRARRELNGGGLSLPADVLAPLMLASLWVLGVCYVCFSLSAG